MKVFFLEVTLLPFHFTLNISGMLELHIRVSILPKRFSTSHHMILITNVITWTEDEYPPPPSLLNSVDFIRPHYFDS